ncbi:hypothetical protein EDB86DRAFT_3089663 [Lactarius hatsudake]|nr:hypothetical protein EDB86DRAFT_3089663 [Lactarius hatsudake]
MTNFPSSPPTAGTVRRSQAEAAPTAGWKKGKQSLLVPQPQATEMDPNIDPRLQETGNPQEPNSSSDGNGWPTSAFIDIHPSHSTGFTPEFIQLSTTFRAAISCPVPLALPHGYVVVNSCVLLLENLRHDGHIHMTDRLPPVPPNGAPDSSSLTLRPRLKWTRR